METHRDWEGSGEGSRGARAVGGGGKEGRRSWAEALWPWSPLRVKGILPSPPRYDDYDYGEVNQLLERSLKVYIKTVACYPEKATKRMYTHFWRHFKHSEKVRPLPSPAWGQPWRQEQG